MISFALRVLIDPLFLSDSFMYGLSASCNHVPAMSTGVLEFVCEAVYAGFALWTIFGSCIDGKG
jgi:hypothetical protein